MDNLDFSEEEIQEQLSILGYKNIPKHKLLEFKQDLDSLIGCGEWKSLMSATQTDTKSQSSPPPFTKEKVSHVDHSSNGFFLHARKGNQDKQLLSTREDRNGGRQQERCDSYAHHSVAQELQLPPGAPDRLQVEADLEDSMPDSVTPPPDTQRTCLIKRKVLRKHGGQSLVCDESVYSEDSAPPSAPLTSTAERVDTMYRMYNTGDSEEDKDSLNSSFWSDGEKQKEEDDEEVELQRGLNSKPADDPERVPAETSEELKSQEKFTREVLEEGSEEEEEEEEENDEDEEDDEDEEEEEEDDEDEEEEEEEEDVSCESPAPSLMTSGYGTYRAEEQRDDRTITELDQDSQEDQDSREDPSEPGDDDDDWPSLGSCSEFAAEPAHTADVSEVVSEDGRPGSDGAWRRDGGPLDDVITDGAWRRDGGPLDDVITDGACRRDRGLLDDVITDGACRRDEGLLDNVITDGACRRDRGPLYDVITDGACRRDGGLLDDVITDGACHRDGGLLDDVINDGACRRDGGLLDDVITDGACHRDGGLLDDVIDDGACRRDRGLLDDVITDGACHRDGGLLDDVIDDGACRRDGGLLDDVIPDGVCCREGGLLDDVITDMKAEQEEQEEEVKTSEEEFSKQEREDTILSPGVDLNQDGEREETLKTESRVEADVPDRDMRFMDSKMDSSWRTYNRMCEEWEGDLRQMRETASHLEERLAGLRLSTSAQRDFEEEDEDEEEATHEESDVQASEADSLSAFESYIRGMTRTQSDGDLRPKPKSFIRPVMSQQTIKKTDPVAKYFQYKQLWDMFRPPGEKDRKSLRWEIKERLAYQPPPPRPRRVYVPNTYTVPTEKKRSALRWEIRNDLANRLLPHSYPT